MKPTIKKPIKKKGKGTPPTEQDTTLNLQKVSATDNVNLNFKVSPEFKKEFKAYCVENGYTMSFWIQEVFNRYKDEMRR